MLAIRLLAGALLPLILALPAVADAPKSLRFVPAQANLVIHVEKPRQLLRAAHRGIDGYKVGDAYFTQVENALLFANKKEAMQAALDTHLDKKRNLADAKGPGEARKAVPPGSLAWLWLDLDVARKAPNAKEVF